MIIKLLTEHHLEFLSLKGGCKGLSESRLVKMQHCWKSHVTAHLDRFKNCIATKMTWLFGFSELGQHLGTFSRPLIPHVVEVEARRGQEAVGSPQVSHIRDPPSSGNHGKPGKSLNKFHAWKNQGI